MLLRQSNLFTQVLGQSVLTSVHVNYNIVFQSQLIETSLFSVNAATVMIGNCDNLWLILFI